MPHFRITIRHGAPHRYHVVDVESTDLRAAAERAAAEVPPDDDADLIEIRRLADPEARSYV